MLQPRVPMRKCTSRLDSGRATTGITRTASTGRTMGTIGLIIGMAGIVITVITVTIGTKVTQNLGIQIELAREQSRASFLQGRLLYQDTPKWRDPYFFDLGDSTGFAAGPLVG